MAAPVGIYASASGTFVISKQNPDQSLSGFCYMAGESADQAYWFDGVRPQGDRFAFPANQKGPSYPSYDPYPPPLKNGYWDLTFLSGFSGLQGTANVSGIQRSVDYKKMSSNIDAMGNSLASPLGTYSGMLGGVSVIFTVNSLNQPGAAVTGPYDVVAPIDKGTLRIGNAIYNVVGKVERSYVEFSTTDAPGFMRLRGTTADYDYSALNLSLTDINYNVQSNFVLTKN